MQLNGLDKNSIINPVVLSDFVVTDYISNVVDRALAYIKAGFAIHLRGRSGTGKTSIAMYISSKLNRPTLVIHGDEEFRTSDLIGGRYGYRIRKTIDNFVQSVVKVEEDLVERWVDSRLTTACKNGYTLVYDEFTRSRPEANNILLSVLQERLLDISVARGAEEGYVKVHPDFTAIFTSNPEDYAGVYGSQDALRDRMVTLDLDNYDKETEISIIKSKSKLSREDSERVVNILRDLRELGDCEYGPTIRGGIMIAKTLQVLGAPVDKNNEMFRQICEEVLASETSRAGNLQALRKVRKVINELFNKYA
ncbi:gas vesicle protein GvpN [Desulfofarcimen acetoxidans DSM 771]|jgi:gas vesicle protein GvpN|uniref:Gas vesicle protein GvpN n=1 Tax=Desulfofarcimen acetoxidans (strain ATCC 49208 / DSM 771 / KCTC 5769 / VKM B-1644 / 5575) TaxID=485916 RepID=C8W3J7_DESAS|nr:gas vesicle protein GvpN [Desulfofarcimen acetoxidans]ACV63783.1 gas vesicle protein GvpN [Desulfofarcimen acetoxidans DSM 771]